MNKPLFILLVVDALHFGAAAMLGPIYAIYVADIGGDLLDASIAASIFSFITAGALFIASRIENSLKEIELAVMFGYILTAIGYIGYIFVSSITMLFLIQVILGIGNAARAPAYDGLYSKHLDEDKETAQWGNWEAMFAFVTGLGAIVGGVIVAQFGFVSIFILMAAIEIAAALTIFYQPRELL